MDFNKRKDLAKPIIDYLKSDDCSMENLLGLKAVIEAIHVAIDRRLLKMAHQRDKLRSKLKIDDENSWLD